MWFGRTPAMVDEEHALVGRSTPMVIDPAHAVLDVPMVPPYPVMVVFDPRQVSFDEILSAFFEHHDPTQGYRQGNDVGTQYRSAIFTTSAEQLVHAERAAAAFGEQLAAANFGAVTTEIRPAGPFYFAEDYHQQYLVKNPMGYCGLGGTGVSCPVGLFRS